MPEAKSRASTRPTVRPRVAASSASPRPTTPPPTTRTSSSPRGRTSARMAASASSAASRDCGRECDRSHGRVLSDSPARRTPVVASGTPRSRARIPATRCGRRDGVTTVNERRSTWSNDGLGCGAMPGTIQSIERAAAMLRLLGGAGRPLALAEIAAPLDLARPPRTASCARCADVGFVDQDRDTGRYTLGAGLRRLHGGWDRHELRARAMNWADSLAGSTGQEVLLGMPAGDGAERRAPRLPARRLRRSGCGRARRSRCTPRPSASACWRSPRSPCRRCTSWTCSATPGARVVAPAGWPSTSPWPGPRLGRRSWGSTGPGVGGVAAPVRTAGGLVVGALGVEGPVEELFGGGGTAGAAAGRPAGERGAGDLGGARGDAVTIPTERGAGSAVTERVVAAIDQGTTSTRCLLFNPAGRMVAVAPARAPPALPAAGLGRARRRGDLAQRHRGSCPPRCAAPGWARRTSSRWASPTSARPPSSGTGAPACRWPARSPGRTPARTGSSPGSSTTARAALVDAAVRAAAGHLLRRPAAALAARPRAGRPRAAPRRATCCSGRWRAG